MRLSTKHANQQTVEYIDFSGGVNLLKSPDQIDMKDLQKGENVEFDRMNGSLTKCPGLTPVFDAALPVHSLFMLGASSGLFSSGTDLYVTNLSTKTLLGSLTGTSKPHCAHFGDDTVIASGGTIQKYDGTLTTISDIYETVEQAPLADLVKIRDARVWTASNNSDEIILSATGDASKWRDISNDDSSGKRLQVGYKDGGHIVAWVEFGADLLVFKDNYKIFRVIGSYPNWSVKEVSDVSSCANKNCALQAENLALFLGMNGLQAVKTVQEYGDMQTTDVGEKINNYLEKNVSMTSAALWHLPTRRQVWAQSQSSGLVYMMSLLNGGITTRRFSEAINDVATWQSAVYICRGNKILELRDDVETDDGEDYVGIIIPKTLTTVNQLLLKRITIDTYNITSGAATLTISGSSIVLPLSSANSGDIAALDTDIAALDEDPVVTDSYTTTSKRLVYRAKKITPVVTISSGILSVRKIALDVVEV